MMQTVRIQREKLRNKLLLNRDTHAREYEEAVAGFRLAVENALRHALARLINDDKVELGPVNKLSAPVSHVAEYDRSIAMLEYSVDAVIELPHRTFQQLVLDEWDWKHEFNMAKTMYAVGASVGQGSLLGGA